MNNRMAITALMAIFLATTESSFARNDKSDGERNGRGRSDQAQRGERYEGRQNYARPPAHRPNYQPSNWRSNRFDGRYERGAGPEHQFYRGDYLAREYNHRQYVVDDWRGHHLSAPPRGYHWIQTGGDYVLVAIATGIIMELLLNN
jgi:Ni/Co efflux regulator RcnB